MKKSTVCLIVFLFVGSIGAQTYRYTENLFSETIKSAPVVYGQAAFLQSPYIDESITSRGDLVMDMYEGKGDTRTDRPVIIFAHGGGFIQGNRNVDDMVAFCTLFARKGYVAVSIDYRQGVQVFSNGDLHYTRAAFRGLQDGRAAVRFLRAHAVTYGIDASKIYWGGNSAGSFIGLQSIYMDTDEIPSAVGVHNYSENFVSYSAPNLGGLDIGLYLTENGEPDAVMACWGGVGDVATIEAENNQHVFLIHGTADATVPFNSGPPFGLSSISAVYGSNALQNKLIAEKIPAQMTYFVVGADHEFYGVDNGTWSNGTGGNAYWDTVVVKATAFYHTQFNPTAQFDYTQQELTFDFTDQSTDAVSYIWNFGDGSAEVTTQNPTHTYAVAGTYSVRLYVENTHANWDTLGKTVTASGLVTLDDDALSARAVMVYPRIVSTLLTVTSPAHTIQKISITDVAGIKMLEKSGVRPLETVSLAGFKSGIYMVTMQMGNEVVTTKIVKE